MNGGNARVLIVFHSDDVGPRRERVIRRHLAQYTVAPFVNDERIVYPEPRSIVHRHTEAIHSACEIERTRPAR